MRRRVLTLLAFTTACATANNVGLGGLPTWARGGSAQKLRDALPGGGLERAADAQIFHQLLDHRAEKLLQPGQQQQTFPQRYYIDDTYFKGDGYPTFLNIAGEGPCNGAPGGFVAELGKKHGARLVSLEHRFYGKSVPGDDMSVDNLQYLTVEQSLADLALFIDNGLGLKEARLRGDKPKVFTFGGSYSGALSAFFRSAYPTHTLGSLSSSGVVDPLFNFWQFDQEVSIAAGPACAAALRNVTAAFEAAEQQGSAGPAAAAARKAMGARAGLSSSDFFYMLADSSAMAVQYGHKDTVCSAMTKAVSEGADLIAAFANFTTSLWGADFPSMCFYDTQCLTSSPDKWQPTSRSWRWQKCTELAYLQAAPTEGQSALPSLRTTRYLTMPDLLKQCEAVFGKHDLAAATERILAMFGGKNFKGSNVFFSNGSDDPWQRASVNTSEPSKQLPELTIECSGCGHCVDLGPSRASDPPALTQGREKIALQIGKWLSE